MNESDNIVVMDQFSKNVDASTASVVHTGQLNVDASGSGANSKAHVRLVEQPVAGLLMLRASSEEQIAALGAALQTHCGVALASRLSSNTSGDYCVRWMGPDAWLLSCPLSDAFSIEQKLRGAVSGHIAIVQISGGYSVFELSGAKALEVLQKSSGYDTHPDNFPVGKVVNTTFAKAQITIRAVQAGDEASYELIVRRSFSDYIWIWLQRASYEYGLDAVGS